MRFLSIQHLHQTYQRKHLQRTSDQNDLKLFLSHLRHKLFVVEDLRESGRPLVSFETLLCRHWDDLDDKLGIELETLS